MQHRRSLRLAAGALVLAMPLLSSCGFGKATDRIYTPAAGVNHRHGEVDVLSAVVVADQAHSGTFIATMSNNSPDQDDSLESITQDSDDSGNVSEVGTLDIADLSPAVDVAARGYVNLADDEQGVAIKGDFDAGDMLHLTLTFSSGETATMKVPVVFACDEWEGLDTSVSDAPSSSPSASSSADVPEPGEPYDCAAELYDTDSDSHTEPLVP
jgi:copper(I)-binding protein